MIQTAFLFDPEHVAQTLSSLPHLQTLLPTDPYQEGEQSVGFRQARKSPRQIYRILGNTHYPQLVTLLQTMEYCRSRGFIPPTVMRTRERTSFTESLAELYAAEHFLLSGFAVAGLDATKGQESVPDFIAKGHALELAVEVYCPRVWAGLSNLDNSIVDAIKNLDMPFNYKFKVCITEKNFGASRHPLPHPGELSNALTSIACDELVSAVQADLMKKLDGSATNISIKQPRPDLKIDVSVLLSSITGSAKRLPARSATIVGPALTGYSPEGMFKRLLARNIRKKAHKRQAVGYSPLSLLLIDLSHSEITSELDHSYYRKNFLKSIETNFGPSLAGYDMIAFTEMPDWHCNLRPHFLIREERVSIETVRLIFGKDIAWQDINTRREVAKIESPLDEVGEELAQPVETYI